VVSTWPLAFCDGSKVSYDDLVECDHVQRNYTGSSLNLLYHPGREWFYLSQQTKDEVAIFKNFDSSPSVKANVSLAY
jgi:hypothetical protein